MPTPKDDPFSSTLGSTSSDKVRALKAELFESGAKHVEAANKFQAGLDKVVDVLLILVLKFGRASTLLVATGIFSLVCLVTLIVATVQIISLRGEVKDLLDRQVELAKAQSRIEQTTNDTQQKVATTSKQVEETSAKVDDVADSAPKVVVDTKTGKPRLVVPVPPKTPKPKPASSADDARKLEIKLE